MPPWFWFCSRLMTTSGSTEPQRTKSWRTFMGFRFDGDLAWSKNSWQCVAAHFCGGCVDLHDPIELDDSLQKWSESRCQRSENAKHARTLQNASSSLALSDRESLQVQEGIFCEERCGCPGEISSQGKGSHGSSIGRIRSNGSDGHDEGPDGFHGISRIASILGFTSLFRLPSG